MMGQNLGGHGRNEGVLERLQRETVELAAMVKQNGNLLDELSDKSRKVCAENERLRKQNESLLTAVRQTTRAMRIQEKRETEEFHLSAEAFAPMWFSAIEGGEQILREIEGGAT